MTYRCPICRTRRKDLALFTAHLADSGHGKDKLCRCTAMRYPHRPLTHQCLGFSVTPVTTPLAYTDAPVNVTLPLGYTVEAVNVNGKPVDFTVTKKRGRPSKPDALTPAERAKAYRDRKKAAKRRNVPAAAYRGPNGETWSGRGLVPKWLQVLCLQLECSRDAFLVPNPAQRGLPL